MWLGAAARLRRVVVVVTCGVIITGSCGRSSRTTVTDSPAVRRNISAGVRGRSHEAGPKQTKHRWKRRTKENSIARTREHEGNKPGGQKDQERERENLKPCTGRTRHTPVFPQSGLTPHAWTLRVLDSDIEIACGALHRSNGQCKPWRRG